MGEASLLVELGGPRHQLEDRRVRRDRHAARSSAGRSPGSGARARSPPRVAIARRSTWCSAESVSSFVGSPASSVGRDLGAALHRPLEQLGADAPSPVARPDAAPLPDLVRLALAGPARFSHTKATSVLPVPDEPGVLAGMRPHRLPLVVEVLELEGLAALVDGFDGGEQLRPLWIVFTARGRPPELGHGVDPGTTVRRPWTRFRDARRGPSITYETVTTRVATVTLDRPDALQRVHQGRCATRWRRRGRTCARTTPSAPSSSPARREGVLHRHRPERGARPRAGSRSPSTRSPTRTRAGGSGRAATSAGSRGGRGQRHGLRRRLLPARRGRHRMPADGRPPTRDAILDARTCDLRHAGGLRPAAAAPMRLRRSRRCRPAGVGGHRARRLHREPIDVGHDQSSRRPGHPPVAAATLAASRRGCRPAAIAVGRARARTGDQMLDVGNTFLNLAMSKVPSPTGTAASSADDPASA